MLRFVIHYGCHFVFPFALAYFVFPGKWKQSSSIILLSMLIDFDHLLATPIFDPNRCSIGFHPLHNLYAGVIYLVLTYFPKTRIWGIALLWHLVTDQFDCWLM